MGSLLVTLVVGYFLFRALSAVFNRTRKKPLTRNVARLGGEDEDAEAKDDVAEVVDVSGGPLKPKQLRLALRDPRLLPKPERARKGWRKEPKPKVMPYEEARRLFAGTLRNRDRNIRDLTTDAEQLQRYRLPLWRSEDDVAQALGISVKRLRHYSIHRKMERVAHYIRFAIPKRSGGERVILAPKRELKALQRKLKTLLVDQLPLSDMTEGFRSGHSIATHAARHVGHRVVLKMDLKDFFPTVHVGRIRGYLVSLGYSYPVATTLAVLMTEAERQPVKVGETIFYSPVGSRHAVQGAPTSPGICNSIAQKLDHRLAGLAGKAGFAYSRYADDLTFSGDAPESACRLIKNVHRIVHEEGFVVNDAKTRIMRQSGAQVVTGVTVNREMGLSRRKRRQIRAALHQASRAPSSMSARLRGVLAFVRMLNPAQADRLERKAS